jgi:hypothetical protein
MVAGKGRKSPIFLCNRDHWSRLSKEDVNPYNLWGKHRKNRQFTQDGFPLVIARHFALGVFVPDTYNAIFRVKYAPWLCLA